MKTSKGEITLISFAEKDLLKGTNIVEKRQQIVNHGNIGYLGSKF